MLKDQDPSKMLSSSLQKELQLSEYEKVQCFYKHEYHKKNCKTASSELSLDTFFGKKENVFVSWDMFYKRNICPTTRNYISKYLSDTLFVKKKKNKNNKKSQILKRLTHGQIKNTSFIS